MWTQVNEGADLGKVYIDQQQCHGVASLPCFLPGVCVCGVGCNRYCLGGYSYFLA